MLLIQLTKNTETILNTELEKVSSWLAANMNVKKSNFLHFHQGKTQKTPLTIKTNGTIVEEKENIKYLETLIDNKLNFYLYKFIYFKN